MVPIKHIAVTALILVALIGGLGMVTAAEKRGETSVDKTNVVIKNAIDVCGASIEEQAELMYVMNASKAYPIGSALAKYGMWTNDLSMVSMGSATPGHVWGGNGQNDSIEIWYTHTSPFGGTFA